MESAAIVSVVTTLGPVGVLFLGAWYIYIRFGPRALFEKTHSENLTRLSEIHNGVTDCARQLHVINGRIVKLEEWRQAHEKQDDEREVRHNEEHHQLVREAGRVRETVHNVRNELATEMLRRITRNEQS